MLALRFAVANELFDLLLEPLDACEKRFHLAKALDRVISLFAFQFNNYLCHQLPPCHIRSYLKTRFLAKAGRRCPNESEQPAQSWVTS